MRHFLVGPVKKPLIGPQNILNDRIQTRKSDQATTQTALFRGRERVRAALHYSCSLSRLFGNANVVYGSQRGQIGRETELFVF